MDTREARALQQIRDFQLAHLEIKRRRQQNATDLQTRIEGEGLAQQKTADIRVPHEAPVERGRPLAPYPSGPRPQQKDRYFINLDDDDAFLKPAWAPEPRQPNYVNHNQLPNPNENLHSHPRPNPSIERGSPVVSKRPSAAFPRQQGQPAERALFPDTPRQGRPYERAPIPNPLRQVRPDQRLPIPNSLHVSIPSILNQARWMP